MNVLFDYLLFSVENAGVTRKSSGRNTVKPSTKKVGNSLKFLDSCKEQNLM